MRKFATASFALALTAPLAPALAQAPSQAGGAVQLESIVAVVGDAVITRYELQEQVLSKIQQRAVPEPKTSADTLGIEVDVLNDMIEEELLLQKAKDLKIEVTDADITPNVDRQIKQTRANFSSETEYRTALGRAGLGTPEDYRKYLMDQFRRQYLHERILRKLQEDGKIIPVNVTDAQIAMEFEKAKPFLGAKPATVTWRQIVIAPQAGAEAREAARVKAESLLAEIRAGGDFERIAKRESMDLQTKDVGGDIGWMRRGDNVPEFDRWLFGSPFQSGLQPGQVSNVFGTAYGYHIVRVDRIQVGEVKARQILIVPKMDSSDIARARSLADSVATMLKNGAPFDTLARKYNDYAGKEETSLLNPWVRDSLPLSYQNAFASKQAGDIVTFQIAGSGQRPDIPKFVVAQLASVNEAGEYTLPEMKALVRAQLADRGGVRRYINQLRGQTYVSVRLPGYDGARRDR